DDCGPPEVPALVVRLEPRVLAVQQTGYRLPIADGRPLPGDRCRAGGASGAALPNVVGPQPPAAAGEVATGLPTLPGAGRPRPRLSDRDDRRVVRHRVHGPVSAGAVRLRGGRAALAESRLPMPSSWSRTSTRPSTCGQEPWRVGTDGGADTPPR